MTTPSTSTDTPATTTAQMPTAVAVTPVVADKQKKLLLIIGLVIGLLLATAAIAFAAYQSYWNNDLKVLTDAFTQLVAVDTVKIKGELSVADPKASNRISVNLNSHSSTTEQSLSLTATAQLEDYLSIHLAGRNTVRF